MQDDGGEVGKLEAFMNFCEDTIFEVYMSWWVNQTILVQMQHAASMNSEDDVDNKHKKDISSAGFVASWVVLLIIINNW